MQPFIFLLVASLFFVLPVNVHGQNITLRYGQIPSTLKTVSALQFHLAQRKGFFAREGIALEVLPIDGGAANMVLALSKGVLNGSENVAVFGETGTPIYSLIARAEIENFADLKGKTVGLSLAVDTISISTRKLMALHGIKEGDFKVKELVGTPARSACLKKSECDAVPLGQPEDFLLMQEGYRRLGVSTEAMSNFQFIVGAVRRSWANQNKDALVRYARALATSYRYMREAQNRDEVVRLIVETTGTSETIARETLRLYFEPDRGVFPRRGKSMSKDLAKYYG